MMSVAWSIAAHIGVIPDVFGTIQNVFTLTDYSGIDPTAGVTGIDRNIYPQSRTFMTGFTVGF